MGSLGKFAYEGPVGSFQHLLQRLHTSKFGSHKRYLLKRPYNVIAVVYLMNPMCILRCTECERNLPRSKSLMRARGQTTSSPSPQHGRGWSETMTCLEAPSRLHSVETANQGQNL
jgi:hypothetical protein